VLYEMHTRKTRRSTLACTTVRRRHSWPPQPGQPLWKPAPGVRDLFPTISVTAWNGMMVAALAHASQVFDEPRYLAAAESTAQFLRSHLYDPQSKRLSPQLPRGKRDRRWIS